MKKAWFALTIGLALHVLDEACTGFLDFYNPFVMMLRDVLLIQWLPTFEFGPWLGGLIVAIALLALLGYRASDHVLMWCAVPYGWIMFFNALGHMGMSIYTQRLIPGTISSPVLFAASGYLLTQAVLAWRR